MVCQTYGLHAGRLSRERRKSRKRRKRRRQLRQLQTSSWVLDSRKSRKPRKWRKPRKSRVQTTGSPNHGFRNTRLSGPLPPHPTAAGRQQKLPWKGPFGPVSAFGPSPRLDFPDHCGATIRSTPEAISPRRWSHSGCSTETSPLWWSHPDMQALNWLATNTRKKTMESFSRNVGQWNSSKRSN